MLTYSNVAFVAHRYIVTTVIDFNTTARKLGRSAVFWSSSTVARAVSYNNAFMAYEVQMAKYRVLSDMLCMLPFCLHFVRMRVKHKHFHEQEWAISG